MSDRHLLGGTAIGRHSVRPVLTVPGLLAAQIFACPVADDEI